MIQLAKLYVNSLLNEWWDGLLILIFDTVITNTRESKEDILEHK